MKRKRVSRDERAAERYASKRMGKVPKHDKWTPKLTAMIQCDFLAGAKFARKSDLAVIRKTIPPCYAKSGFMPDWVDGKYDALNAIKRRGKE